LVGFVRAKKREIFIFIAHIGSLNYYLKLSIWFKKATKNRQNGLSLTRNRKFYSKKLLISIFIFIFAV